MSKKLTTRTNDVLDTDRIAINGNILELGGNVSFESVEQIGFNLEKYGHIDITDDRQFSGQVTLATNVTEIKELTGNWGTSSDTPYDAPEGTIQFVNRDGLFYKVNGVGRYIGVIDGQTSGSLDFKGDVTANGKKYTGYSEKGGFTPLFTKEQYQALLNLIK